MSKATSAASSVVSSLFNGDDHASQTNSLKAGFGFGRQGEKAAGLNGYLISKPIETLPRYATKATPTGNTDVSA
ncbi:hypothetical protein C0993_004481 [Termitomyces sp. T159_Od127]|nr:hypothetical protein C0993_004481 [Termitomyces sp. T159_Od127]